MKTFKEQMERLAALRSEAAELAKESKALNDEQQKELRELEAVESKAEEIRLIAEHLKVEMKDEILADVRTIQKEHTRMKELLRDAMSGEAQGAEKRRADALDRLKRSFLAMQKEDITTLRAIRKEAIEAMPEEQRADFQAEGVAADGGAIVETELMNELIRDQEKVGGILRSLCRVVPMNSQKKKANTLAGQAVVSMVGEAGIGLQSTFVFGDKVLTAKKMHAKVLGTNEWVEDNWTGEQIWAALREILLEGFGLEEDAQCLNGSGSGNNLQGILTSTDSDLNILTAATATAAGITPDLLLDMQLALPTNLNRGSKVGYMMNKVIWANILKKKDTTGQYIIRQPIDKADIDAGILGYIWNRPVFSCDSMPSTVSANTKYVIFANFEKACYFGHRKTVEFKKLTEATLTVNVGDAGGETETEIHLADQDIEAVKATQRIAFEIVRPKGIAILKAAAS